MGGKIISTLILLFIFLLVGKFLFDLLKEAIRDRDIVEILLALWMCLCIWAFFYLIWWMAVNLPPDA